MVSLTAFSYQCDDFCLFLELSHATVSAWCRLPCYRPFDKGSDRCSWRYSADLTANWFEQFLTSVVTKPDVGLSCFCFVSSFGHSQTTSWYGCGCTLCCFLFRYCKKSRGLDIYILNFHLKGFVKIFPLSLRMLQYEMPTNSRGKFFN